MTKRQAKKRAYSMAVDILFMTVRSSSFADHVEPKTDRERVVNAMQEVMEELKSKASSSRLKGEKK